MGSTRDAILEALENLTADEFKKFKLKLLSVPLRDGYGRIPRGPLQSMDAMDLTDKLVSCYLEAYSTELTAQVLRDMGMQETAEWLQDITRKGEQTPPRPPESPSSPRSPHIHPTSSWNICSLGSFTFCSSYPLMRTPPAGKGSFPRLVDWLPDQRAPGEKKGKRTTYSLTGSAAVPADTKPPTPTSAVSSGKAFTPNLGCSGHLTSPIPPHHTPAQPICSHSHEKQETASLRQPFPPTYLHNSLGPARLRRKGHQVIPIPLYLEPWRAVHLELHPLGVHLEQF